MNKTNLINILRTFSGEEMKLFEKFVNSPFHFNGKNCRPLYKQLQKFHPDFVSEQLRKEIIYKKLYPGKNYNKQVMWNLTSALEKMAKEFLVQAALRNKKITKKELLLSELGVRKLLNDYLKKLNEMEKVINSGGIDFEFFENNAHMENYIQEYYHLIDKIKPMGESKLKASEYQIILLLRMLAGGLNDMKILSEEHNYIYSVDLPLEFAKNLNLKNFADYANKNNFQYSFLIEIYYHSIMLHLEPGGTAHLLKIRELYELNFNKFTMSEKRAIMHWIVNYCIKNAQYDDSKYKRLIFELNEFRLKEGLVYYPENQIPKVIYIQFLLAALSINETKWVEDFINKYTVKLQPDERHPMRSLANAYLNFHKKEYREVLNNLHKFSLTDIYHKLFARVLIAKSYYELGETESLLNYIDSSFQFLKNNNSQNWIYILNFFKYIKKLVFIKDKKDYEQLYLLREKIDKNKNISDRNWFFEKFNEIKNNK